ncbi:MAG: cyclic nucleotide-binding domain-containing protein [Planctomycetota bacterium]|nr:MAG: cyclic nucleotide-binding domain-containing protein [Planctomycetota bacterium]
MEYILKTAEVFAGLPKESIERLISISRPQHLDKDEYLFRIGDQADRFFLVRNGEVATCLPLRIAGGVRDIAVDTIGPGEVLGWSAFVQPHRFTLSARATRETELIAFDREGLSRFLASDPDLGSRFFARLTEIIGHRLLTIQALWGRELQRTVSAGLLEREETAQQS